MSSSSIYTKDFTLPGMMKKVRGLTLLKVQPGDVLAFYAGLRSVIAPFDLVYALIGIITVKNMAYADTVSPSQWNENAHTRRVQNTRILFSLEKLEPLAVYRNVFLSGVGNQRPTELIKLYMRPGAG